jgi:hypothetical protein
MWATAVRGQTVRFWFPLLDTSGVAITGATLPIRVVHEFAPTTALATGNATAADGTNLPGLYYFEYAISASEVYGNIFARANASAVSGAQQQQLFAGYYVSERLAYLDAAISTAPPTTSAIATAVAAAVPTVEEIAEAVGEASDPLTNAVPGSYGAGTAGYQLARIGSAGATVVSPVAASGAVTLYQNATYSTARGTALAWTLTTSISLTGGSVTMDAGGVSYTGAISGSAGAWVITVQLTAAQTAAMALGVTRYDLSATVSSEALPPLATGTLTVLKNV